MNNNQKNTAPRAATPETESREKSTITSIADTQRKIKVVAQNPGEISRIVTIPNTLEAMQELVGGHIETVTLRDGLVLVCNEDGRNLGLPYNCTVNGFSFVGTIFAAGIDGENFGDVDYESIGTYES